MILALVGRKGGTGKTTDATNVATALAVAGHDVCLLDTDAQASAARWAERRNEQQPDRARVHCVQRTGDVRETALDLAGRYAYVVADSGGRDAREGRGLLLVADVVCTPIRPSQIDVETIEFVVELVEEARLYNPKLRVVSLLSLAPTNPRIGEIGEARAALGEAFASALPLLNVVIRERKAFRDAALAGLGVVEMDNAQAKSEIELLVQELLALVPSIASEQSS